MKTTTDLIREYNILHNQEIITDEEHNYLKKHLLDLGDAKFAEEGDVLDASLQNVAKARKQDAKDTFSKAIGVLIIGAIIIAIIIGFTSCVGYLFGGSSGPSYETTYQDDNGNGQLDQGEWNYTTDDHGNVVDVDDDLNNFE